MQCQQNKKSCINSEDIFEQTITFCLIKVYVYHSCAFQTESLCEAMYFPNNPFLNQKKSHCVLKEGTASIYTSQHVEKTWKRHGKFHPFSPATTSLGKQASLPDSETKAKKGLKLQPRVFKQRSNYLTIVLGNYCETSTDSLLGSYKS